MAENLTDSVIVIPIRAGKVPLAERLPGTRMAGQYVTPGGSINRPGNEDGEEVDASIVAAARREFEEEAGLAVDEKRFIYLGHSETKSEADWRPIGGHFFLLPLEEGEEPTRRKEEEDKQGPWKWYSFREAAALPLPAITRGYIHLLAHESSGG